MRIATMVIALGLSLIVLVQSCALVVGGSAVESLSSTPGEGEDLSSGGAVGVFMALFMIAGAGFAIGLPRVALVMFLVAALIVFGGASGTPYKDLWVWGCLALLLGVMSFIGWRGKQRAAIRQQIAAASAPAAGPPTATLTGVLQRYCPNCGSGITAGNRFCPNCGTAVAP